MNTHDKYELQPHTYAPDHYIWYSRELVEKIRQEAIEADRKRRSEPVATRFREKKPYAGTDNGWQYVKQFQPDEIWTREAQQEYETQQLFVAPQTAEPSRGEPVAFFYELATTFDAHQMYSNWSPKLSFSMPNVPDGSIRNLKWLYAAPQPAEPVNAGRVGEMTHKRAAFFLERFKRDEKMLGPNEQWALEYAIEVLEAEPVKVDARASVPSEEIIEAVKAYGMAYSLPNTTATELTIRLQDIRAMLAARENKS